MTVGELVEKLKQYPTDMPIAVQAGDCVDFVDFINVRLYKDSCVNSEYILIGR